MNNYQRQFPTMKRTRDFLQRFGIKKGFLARSLSIADSTLSAFLGEKSVLRDAVYERLCLLLDEWDARMQGFDWNKFRKVEN